MVDMAKTLNKVAALPAGDSWSQAALVRALRAARTGDRVAALKRIGILTRQGRLAKRYRSWGRKVTRTPNAREMLAAGK
jgi:hypothetical protein